MKSLMFLLLLSLVSCAHFTGQDNESNPRYTINQSNNPKANRIDGYGKMKISYSDYSEMLVKTEADNKNSMLSETKAKEALGKLPKGGRVIINIFRMSVYTANTKNFMYVITKNDKEIDRIEGGKVFTGADTVPETPSHSGMDGIYWTNLDIVDLKESINDKDLIKIFVIDKILGGRDEFKISLSPLAPVAAH